MLLFAAVWRSAPRVSVLCARMECIGHRIRFLRLIRTGAGSHETDKTAPLSAPVHTALQSTEARGADRHLLQKVTMMYISV